MSWEKEEKEKGMTRREWVQLGVGAATVASLAGLGGLVAGQILPPPYKMTGEVRDTIQYTKFPTPQWWNTKAGTPVKVSDFQQWQGATGVWRGLFQDTTYVPGTGYPCMIIRIKRESQFFTEPTADHEPVPAGAYSKRTNLTPEPPSLAVAVSVACGPPIVLPAPGTVTEPVGSVLSTRVVTAPLRPTWPPRSVATARRS